MPVSARVSIESRRGSSGTPALVQRVRDAVGQQRVDARPGREDLRRPTPRAAGSRSRAACTSRRSSLATRAKRPEAGHLQQRSGTKATPGLVDAAHGRGSRTRRCSSGREERLRDVALAGVGHDDDDPLALRLSGARGDLQRRPQRRAAGDARRAGPRAARSARRSGSRRRRTRRSPRRSARG